MSFATWASAADRTAWQHSPGFAERFQACRALCDDFHGDDYAAVATI